MKKIIPVLIISLIAMQSCVTSLHPLVTYNTAISDDRLVGNWNADGQDYTVQKFYNSDLFKKLKKEMDKNKSDTSKSLTKKETEDSILYSRSYIVKYTKDKIEYHMFGSMVKLNGQFFINFTAADINTDEQNGQ